MSGFYLMHRGWMETAALAGVKEKFSRRLAWIWMIERATWREQKATISGRLVTLQRGQFSNSFRDLAKVWGWSEAGARRFFDRLKTDAMIDVATDAGQIIVSICNYDKYQFGSNETDAPSDALADSMLTQHDEETDAVKKENIKQGKEAGLFPPIVPPSRILAPSLKASFDDWWEIYPHKVAKEAAWKAFEKLLKTKAVTLDELVSGVNRYVDYLTWPNAPNAANPSTWLNQHRWLDEPKRPSSLTGAQNGETHETRTESGPELAARLVAFRRERAARYWGDDPDPDDGSLLSAAVRGGGA